MLVPQEMGGGGKEVQPTWLQDDLARYWYGPGKQRPGQVVRSGQPVPSCTLPTLTDKRDPARCVFLVDTGATALIYPASFLSVTKLVRLARADRCMQSTDLKSAYGGAP